jgi:hypothetical protein
MTLPSQPRRNDSTYKFEFPEVWGKAIRDGLCQAMKAKMNTRTQPALTESASNGLRPPIDGNIIMDSVDPGT